MKLIKLLRILAFASLVLFSCGEPKLDPNSIFGSDTREKNEFDLWLHKNYTERYNIEFKYRFEDKESDNTYNLVPADYTKSVALAKLVQFLWTDVYSELLGEDFLRQYSPRIFHLIGSPAYNTQGSIVLGTAEGGLKITLFNVNMINTEHINVQELNYWYFKTIHHEFAHILHQTKNYPPEFNLISASDYQSGSWVNLSEKEALKMGFVSKYGSSETQEDFVEIIAVYVTNSEEHWKGLLSQAGENGSAKLKQKLDIVKSYLSTNWNIDLDKLRSIVQRRSQEVVGLDLKSLQ